VREFRGKSLLTARLEVSNLTHLLVAFYKDGLLGVYKNSGTRERRKEGQNGKSSWVRGLVLMAVEEGAIFPQWDHPALPLSMK
jgi:hypothetical protein